MTVKIRRLRLRAETGGGTYGADVEFSSGLNVLWADNTMGKSTTLQAILFVLGLERMLSARREVPLTYVMTSHLVDETSGATHNVLAASVELELSNGSGEIITVRRAVIGENTKLVSVFSGPRLSAGEGTTTFRQTDYFVLDPGSAQREAGFHRFFAQFIGWDLPTVRRFDGGETLLYLETIFPLLYVEQKAGWSSIPAAFPTYLQIRDVSKRAVEFILGLDTHSLELHRQQLEIDNNNLRAEWATKRQDLLNLARQRNARLSGLPMQPAIGADALSGALLEVDVSGDWTPLGSAVRRLRASVQQLVDEPIPTAEEVGSDALGELTRAAASVDMLNAQRVAALRRYRTEAGQLAAAERRIETLEEDLLKNLDVVKLRNLGSALSPNSSLVAHCPTCEQPIRDALVAQSELGEVMPIADNVEYIRSELSMFRQMAAQSAASAETSAAELRSSTVEYREATARLRALRTDLVATAKTPSVAAITERIQLQNRLSALAELDEQFEAEKLAFQALSDEARRLADAKAELPSSRFSDSDLKKLQELTSLVRVQASEYGFSTFEPGEITISEETYRPEKEGFEIGFQLSASDAIRLKWAYQLALLEMGRSSATNHPGFVIFDEPRQQETRVISFQRLLEHAAAAASGGFQVIFATSEDIKQLRGFVSGLDCNLIEFSGKILKKIASASA